MAQNYSCKKNEETAVRRLQAAGSTGRVAGTTKPGHTARDGFRSAAMRHSYSKVAGGVVFSKA